MILSERERWILIIVVTVAGLRLVGVLAGSRAELVAAVAALAAVCPGG